MTDLLRNVKLSTQKVTEVIITFHNEDDAEAFKRGLQEMYETSVLLNNDEDQVCARVLDLLNKYF